MPHMLRAMLSAGCLALLALASVTCLQPASAKQLLSASSVSPCPLGDSMIGKSEALLLRVKDTARSRSLQAHNSSTVPEPDASSASPAPLLQPKDSHKPLVPVSSSDVAVFVVAGFVLFIAAGAGMGGGPVLMPVYLTLGAFSQQAAVALSNSTIFAGSVANVLCNGRKRHPFKDRPLVDWDLTLLMQPTTLLGAVAGSYINKLLPAWISHLLLAVLLTLMTVRVLQRARIVYRREVSSSGQSTSAASQLQAATAAAAPPAAAAVEREVGSSGPGNRQVQMTKQHTPTKQVAFLSPGSGQSPGSSSSSPPLGSTKPLAKSTTTPASSTTASPQAVAAAAAAAGAMAKPSNRPSMRSSDDAVVTLTVQKPSAMAPTAAGSGGQQASDLNGTSSGFVRNDSSALAYAPPGHTRKSSWELQADDWETDWEVWGENERRSHDGSALDSQGNTPRAAAAIASAILTAQGTAADRSLVARSVAVSEGGSSEYPAQSEAGLLPADRISSSGLGAAQRKPPLAPEIAAQSTEMEALVKAESAQVPLVPALLVLALFIAVLLTSLLSKMAGCGTVTFWVVQWSVAPVLGVIFWYSRRRVLRNVARKRAAQYDFHGDIRWTSKNSLAFPAICTLSGMIAGMFGLGGAVVLTPLMLELGVQPQVTAATTQTMLLLTSAASTITYAQMGDIPWDYAAVLLPVAFVATLSGQLALDVVIKKLGKSSVVVLVLAVFFVVACGLTYYVAVDSLRTAAADIAAATVPGKVCGSA